MAFLIRLACLLAVLVAPASAFQSVRVVSNGPASALQTAIDASVDGDTVLVHGGQYDAVTVAAKSITIVAEPELGAIVNGMTIDSIDASRRCVVAGLDLRSGGVVALRIQNCAGSVRLQRVIARGIASTMGSQDAVIVNGSTDVAFARCELRGGAQYTTGGDGAIYPVGRGLVASASRVALYDTSLFGGRGQDSHVYNIVFNIVGAGSGGAALTALSASNVLAARCSFTGGDGGNGNGLTCVHLVCGIGPTGGANGGAGVSAATGTITNLRDSSSAGGSAGTGGTGGQCCPTFTWPPAPNGAPGPSTAGPVGFLPWSSTELVVPSVVRELGSLPITIHGNPGDTVYLGSSSLTRWTLDIPAAGVQLILPLSRAAHLGVIPASGTLSLSVPIGLLPPGVGAQNKYMQLSVRTGRTPLVLGSPATFTILDSIY